MSHDTGMHHRDTTPNDYLVTSTRCFSMETTNQAMVAERMGFEPMCRNYPTIRFRVGAVMATSVPLRSGQDNSTKLCMRWFAILLIALLAIFLGGCGEQATPLTLKRPLPFPTPAQHDLIVVTSTGPLTYYLDDKGAVAGLEHDLIEALDRKSVV